MRLGYSRSPLRQKVPWCCRVRARPSLDHHEQMPSRPAERGRVEGKEEEGEEAKTKEIRNNLPLYTTKLVVNRTKARHEPATTTRVVSACKLTHDRFLSIFTCARCFPFCRDCHFVLCAPVPVRSRVARSLLSFRFLPSPSHFTAQRSVPEPERRQTHLSQGRRLRARRDWGSSAYRIGIRTHLEPPK